MIVLPRKLPQRLLILEAIVRRLENNDMDFLTFSEKLRQVKAGYAGEMRVDREWGELRYPSVYYLLHDLQLVNEFGSTHQIDTIFICENFALIVEVKNIKGRIDFDDMTHQCTRTHITGEVEGLPSAVNQVLRHERYITALFKKLGVRLPVFSAIVFVYPSSIIGEVSKQVRTFHVSGLQQEVNMLYNLTAPAIDEKQLKKLIEQLRGMHTPQIAKIDVNRDKLKTGVLCAACGYRVKMFYKCGKWRCPVCNEASTLPFYEALHDYRILISEKITNCQFRAYFGIPSRSIATKLLTKLNLEKFGSYKDCYYIIPENILERRVFW